MKLARVQAAALLAGLGLAAVLAFYVWRRGVAGAVSDGAGFVVKGIGGAVGIPDTDLDACAKARAEGRTWDASFACPAKDFIRHLIEPAVDATVLDRWDARARRPISQPSWAPDDTTGTGYGEQVGYPSP